SSPGNCATRCGPVARAATTRIPPARLAGFSTADTDHALPRQLPFGGGGEEIPSRPLRPARKGHAESRGFPAIRQRLRVYQRVAVGAGRHAEDALRADQYWQRRRRAVRRDGVRRFGLLARRDRTPGRPARPKRPAVPLPGPASCRVLARSGGWGPVLPLDEPSPRRHHLPCRPPPRP